jgi:hypothetical protein
MGRLDYANGDYYEGQWELDRRHGWGKFFSNSTGHTYEGYWKNGLKVIFSTFLFLFLLINLIVIGIYFRMVLEHYIFLVVIPFPENGIVV